MHNCSKTKEDLLDLVFDELGEAEKARVWTQVQSCLQCQTELQSIEKTLDLYTEVSLKLEPSSTDWQNYQARLLQNFAPKNSAFSLSSILRQFFSASVRIPVPVLGAIVLLVCTTFFLTLRSIEQNNERATSGANEPKSLVSNSHEIEFIEKPVERTIEKIVIQKHFVTKTIRVEKLKNKPYSLAETIAKARKPVNPIIKPLHLSEFQSVNQSLPIVVKGNSFDEK